MQIMTATVGPLATADPDIVSISQVLGGAYALAINGVGASGYSVNNIAQAQNPSGAGDLTLNGTLVTSGVARIPRGQSITITSAGNDSSFTFVVYGQIAVDNPVPGNPLFGSESVAGANTGTVSTRTKFLTVTRVSISGNSAGNVSVGTNGYVATLDLPRRVLITNGGNDTGVTFTVFGTNWQGLPIQEDVVGASGGTIATDQDFSTVTAVWASGAVATTILVGTNGVGSSRPLFLDRFAPAPTALQVVASGTVNYTVQQTLDDPTIIGGPASLDYDDVTWFSHPDSAFVGATASAQGNYAYIPAMTRILLNSGTGTVTYKVLQAASVTGPT
jgi:hypothetical protein